MSKEKKGYGHKQATGRFYAFLSIVIVAIAVVVAFIVIRGRGIGPDIPSIIPSSTSSIEDDDWNNLEIKTIGELEGGENFDPVSDEDKIDVTDLSVTPDLDPTWKNILLLGSDTRDITQNSRTDTVMIASVNTRDGTIKLISLMRDMMLPIPGRGEDKINAAAYFGGPELTIKTINEAFGLNITEYMLVNFTGMQEAIDALGGIYMDVTEEELPQLNHNLIEQAKMIMTREEWDPQKYNLAECGAHIKLTGMQAVAYARIRNVGSGDYERTDRQRKVMEALFEEVKSISIPQMMQMVASLRDCTDTNLGVGSIVTLATTVLKNGVGHISQERLPINGTFKDETRNNKAALYDVDLEQNKIKLHSIIYGG